MKIEHNKKLLPVLVNKQFEMKGIDYSLEEIRKDGTIPIPGQKRREWWYNEYKFDNEEEYMEWRNWMEEEIRKHQFYDVEKEATYVDLRYGMTFKY